MDSKLFVRDVRRIMQGQIDDYTQFDTVLRVNDLGAWSIELPPGVKTDLLRAKGAGIQLERYGVPIMSGPVTKITRAIDQTNDTFTISGVTDDVLLWDTLVRPGQPATNPSNNTWKFPDKVTDIKTDFAETVMYYFVATHVNDPARFIPGVPQVVLGNDQRRGVALTGKGRFIAVAEVLQEVALRNAKLGGVPLIFGITDSVFAIREAEDRTDEVVFSRESGNLLGMTYTTNSSTGTHLLVGGDGEGKGQVIVDYGSDQYAQALGRRIEVFVNARDVAQGDEDDPDYDALTVSSMIEGALAEFARRNDLAEISLSPQDVPNRTFGVDYNLGDIVNAEGVAGVINEVKLTLDADGETITPGIGASSTTAVVNILQQRDAMRKLAKRVSILERTY